MVTEVRRYHPTKFTRFVIYPLLLLVFISFLGVILTLANGFRFTLNDGKIGITKTGMIIVNSRPNDAEVLLNDKDTKRKTSFSFLPLKLNNIIPSDQKVTVKKEGFRTWEKTVKVKPNLVSWLNYVILFPNELDIKESKPLKDKTIIGQSKNRRYLFVSGLEEGVKTYYAYDQNNENLNKVWPKELEPTEAWLKDPEVLTADFSQNNDNILLKVKNGDSFDYAILSAARNGSLASLSKLSIPINKIVWSTSDSNDLYVLSNKDLYRVNVNNLTAEQPILNNVLDFSSERDRNLYYVTQNGETNSFYRANADGSRNHIIDESVVADTSYKIMYSPQNSLIGLLPKTQKSLTVYYELENKVNSMQLSRNIEDFRFSNDGRSVYYYNESEVKRYNWTRSEETTTKFDSRIAKLDWYYDDNHYIVSTEDNFFIVDYDGFNPVVCISHKVKDFYLDPKLSTFIIVDKDDKKLRYQSHF